MKIGKVVSTIDLDRKAQCLTGKSFLVVDTFEGEMVAADQVGAKTGEKVLLITGQAASRFCMEAPVDAAVVAVLND